MQQHRRGALVGLGADVLPQVVEELHVAGDFFFGAAFGGGAGDESAHRTRPFALQNALQAQALFVARDLARDAHVFERRHVDHVAARQRDVRGDARALLAERLLGDLNDDFLAFLQQIGDGGLALIGARDAYAPCAFLRGLLFADGRRSPIRRGHSWTSASPQLQTRAALRPLARARLRDARPGGLRASAPAAARNAMRETSAALAHRALPDSAGGLADPASVRRLRFIRTLRARDLDAFDIAQNHRLDVAIFVVVEQGRDGRLVFGFAREMFGDFGRFQRSPARNSARRLPPAAVSASSDAGILRAASAKLRLDRHARATGASGSAFSGG